MSTLSPLDLIFMSDLEQQVIRCLNEYPNSTVQEVAEIIKLSEREARQIIETLLEQKKVIRKRQKGQKTYAVNYRSLTESRVRKLPQNIWSIFD